MIRLTLFDRLRRGLFRIWTAEELAAGAEPLTVAEDCWLLAVIVLMTMFALADLLLRGSK